MYNFATHSTRYMKRTVASGLFLLVAFGCGNHEKQGTKTPKQVVSEEGFAQEQQASHYRRYTGTVAGQPIVMHFMEYDSTITCNYYYTNIGQNIGLHSWLDTVKNDDTYYLVEDPQTEHVDSPGNWTVRIQGDSMKGTWRDMAGTKEYPILLRENYDNGVQRFVVTVQSDSIQFFPDKPLPHAYSTYQLLLPAGNDEQTSFVRSVIYNKIGCDTARTANIGNCITGLNKEYFDGYTNAIKEEDPAMQAEAFNNWESSINNWVMYNEDGIIVLNYFHYEYTGGAHGN